MGVHGVAVGEGHRGLRRIRSPDRFVRVRLWSACGGLKRASCFENGRGNTALRKLGAVEEGVLRRSVRRNGEYVDQVLWSLLKEDWGDHWVSIAPRVH